MARRGLGFGGIVLAFIGVLALFACIIGGCAKSAYDNVVRLDEDVKTQWAQIETQLQRRLDLIDNVVAAVRGGMQHEKDVFTHLADARTKYFNASQGGSRAEQMAASNTLGGALSRLLVLQESYPELKANDQVHTLIVELEGTENRIGVARKRYNDAARELNTYRRSLFGRFVAGWADVGEAAYFEAPKEAQQAPKVDLGGG